MDFETDVEYVPRPCPWRWQDRRLRRPRGCCAVGLVPGANQPAPLAPSETGAAPNSIVVRRIGHAGYTLHLPGPRRLQQAHGIQSCEKLSPVHDVIELDGTFSTAQVYDELF